MSKRNPKGVNNVTCIHNVAGNGNPEMCRILTGNVEEKNPAEKKAVTQHTNMEAPRRVISKCLHIF